MEIESVWESVLKEETVLRSSRKVNRRVLAGHSTYGLCAFRNSLKTVEICFCFRLQHLLLHAILSI
jgi:hypothetical protein